MALVYFVAINAIQMCLAIAGLVLFRLNFIATDRNSQFLKFALIVQWVCFFFGGGLATIGILFGNLRWADPVDAYFVVSSLLMLFIYTFLYFRSHKGLHNP
jgi:hypothetical protein